MVDTEIVDCIGGMTRVGDTIDSIKRELQVYADPGKAMHSYKFFQAYPGGYGEGDKFLGLKVPEQRKVAQAFYKDVTTAEVEKLLQEDIHEYRLTALFILTYKYAKAERSQERQEIAELYLRNLAFVNNWDLVDASAEKILGPYLADKDRSLLYKLADSGDLWKQRVAVIATFYFIHGGQFEDTLQLAERLLSHKHDLIHKAVGWMLREVGKRDLAAEEDFLKKHYKNMPRTMLRYAIEKLEPERRKMYLQGEI